MDQPQRLHPACHDAIAELRKADDWGLRAADYRGAGARQRGPFEMLADVEIKVGLAVLKYGRHARGGRLDPRSVSRLFDQDPPVYDPKTLIAAVAVADPPDAYLRGLHPQHPQFERLRQAMLAARGIQACRSIRRTCAFRAGRRSSRARITRTSRCCASGSASPAPADGKEDDLRRCAGRCGEGLPAAARAEADRRYHNATRNALNEALRPSAPSPSSGCIVNMERWRWMPEDLGAFYVWDSVPEQMTQGLQGGQAGAGGADRGRQARTPTPMFSANMLFMIFHPSWGVPPGMKANELLPQLRNAGGGFLRRFGGAPRCWRRTDCASPAAAGRSIPTRSTGRSGDIHQYDFVQPPGPKNVLGIVKFRFPNKHNVYMHDTPERHLFGGAMRAFSHGCMRVQNPVRLRRSCWRTTRAGRGCGGGLRAARRRDQAHHARSRCT